MTYLKSGDQIVYQLKVEWKGFHSECYIEEEYIIQLDYLFGVRMYSNMELIQHDYSVHMDI